MTEHGYADDVTVFYCVCGEQFDVYDEFEKHLEENDS